MKLPFDISKFATKKELFAHIITNKAELLDYAKSTIKQADAYGFFPCNIDTIEPSKGVVIKSNDPVPNPPDQLGVIAVINTTNVMDSHKDVHIPGLWAKSLQENKRIKHIQEHKRSFEAVISSGVDLKSFAKYYTWKDLGYNFEGKTQALVFNSNVRKDRNEFMHGQYAKGFVDNHSVGMRYVKLVFCCNDDEFGAEFEAWEKYIKYAINREEVETGGYFWAVTEAKIIEGSAVPDGSNPITPTLENNKSEPVDPLVIIEPRKALTKSRIINIL